MAARSGNLSLAFSLTFLITFRRWKFIVKILVHWVSKVFWEPASDVPLSSEVVCKRKYNYFPQAENFMSPILTRFSLCSSNEPWTRLSNRLLDADCPKSDALFSVMDKGLVYYGFLLKRYPMNRFVLRQNIPMSDDKKLLSVCCSDARSFAENLVRKHLRSGLSTLEDWSIFLPSKLGTSVSWASKTFLRRF
jgi:hypothetical protein